MSKNIILFHTDQQRYDSLGCCGNAAAITPNIDRLAAGGTLFRHHYVSNPVCMPSRASLLTGRHLPAHGVIDNGIPLDGREITMAGALAEAGYETFAAGKLHLTCYQAAAELAHAESMASWQAGMFKDWTGPYYGFSKVSFVLGHGEGNADPALGHYGQWLAEHHPDVPGRRGFEKAPEPKFRGTFRSQVPPEAHNAHYIADCIIERMRNGEREKPFFLFAGFPDPHSPFVPPQRYAEMFDGVELPEPHYREGEHEGKPAFHAEMLEKELFGFDGNARRAPHAEHMRHVLQNTYAMVTQIDDAIGRVLDALDQLGLADDTIVAVTSDHGDLLGDHGLLYKCQVPFASLMHVPLIIRAPGVAASVTDAPVSNVDVMPTLLELAGVQAPPSVQGVSQVPVMTGACESMQPFAFSCGWSKASPRFRLMSLHSDEWRITWFPGQGEGELYDIKADPYEHDNLFDRDSHRRVRDSLMSDLLRTYAQAGPLEPHLVCNW